MMGEWTVEQIQQQFKREIDARFEARNKAHRAQEEKDLALLREAHPGEDFYYPYARDDIYYELYKSSQLTFESNSYRLVVGKTMVCYPDFVEMFNDTTQNWGTAAVYAEVIDGVPRVVISTLLVDYMDDERFEVLKQQLQAEGLYAV